jgi:hypothetical protein
MVALTSARDLRAAQRLSFCYLCGRAIAEEKRRHVIMFHPKVSLPLSIDSRLFFARTEIATNRTSYKTNTWRSSLACAATRPKVAVR